MKNFKKIVVNLILTIFLILGFSYSAKAEVAKLYIADNKLNYICPDGVINPPASLNIDLASVKILNNSYFTDKDKVYVVSEDWHSHVCLFNEISGADPASFVVFNNYFQKDKNNVYSNSNYWGWGTPRQIKDLNIDAATFTVLEGSYAKDKNNIYSWTWEDNGKVKIVPGVDLGTFEIFKEDNNYAMDKNNMYYYNEILTKQAMVVKDNSLYNNLKGKIVLKVEGKGEGFYVSPNKKEIYSLSRPVIAFRIMREQGIGITNNNLEKIPVAGNCPANNSACDVSGRHDLGFSKKQKGKIFIQVEGSGEAWYVNPADAKRYYLGRPTDAFNIMKTLGLGITNVDFEKLTK